MKYLLVALTFSLFGRAGLADKTIPTQPEQGQFEQNEQLPYEEQGQFAQQEEGQFSQQEQGQEVEEVLVDKNSSALDRRGGRGGGRGSYYGGRGGYRGGHGYYGRGIGYGRGYYGRGYYGRGYRTPGYYTQPVSYSWYCEAKDMGIEEHGAHAAQGTTYEVTYNYALQLCQQYHNQCSVQCWQR